MNNEQKRQVKDALMRYVSSFKSQTDAAESLKGVSSSAISQVRNHNWELLSQRMWHHIARQVGFYCGEWQPGDTSAYLLLRILFCDAQHYSMAYGIAIGEGLGKTFTAGHYTRENDNVIYLSCNEEYNRKSFICALMAAAGLAAKGSTPEMTRVLTEYILSKDEPLLILDDAHKLKDRVLHLAILLANGFIGAAGIVIMGNDELRTKITDGVRLKKVGYDDIYKSIGRRFISLGSLGPKDVDVVCRANGLYDEDLITDINNACDSNLHAATDLIQQYLEHRAAA